MPKLTSEQHASERERGQSLVEVAISMVVILFIISGLADLGRLYFTRIALEDGVGEAAIYLAINPDCELATSAPECADPNNACYRLLNSGGGNVVDWSQVDCTDPNDLEIDGLGAGAGVIMSVEVFYDFELITPIIQDIVSGIQGGDGNLLRVSSRASQVIIREG